VPGPLVNAGLEGLIAKNVITTEAIVVNKPEEGGAMPPPQNMGGMGGMGGMM
jgi:chaperonin GroEL